MIENKRAESLVGIIVGILLLSFVVLGLYNLILYSDNINTSFEENSVKGILKDNTINIIYKIDTSGLNQGDIFYIYKDNNQKEFKLFTGSNNVKYKYIDKNGEFVDTGITDINIYEREIILDKIDIKNNSKIFKVNINDYSGQ